MVNQEYLQPGYLYKIVSKNNLIINGDTVLCISISSVKVLVSVESNRYWGHNEGYVCPLISSTNSIDTMIKVKKAYDEIDDLIITGKLPVIKKKEC